MTEFSGAKVAILQAGQVLTLLRDNRADIPFPNRWDLPGGGREGAETPVECIMRETLEELSVPLCPAYLVWRRCYAGVLAGQGQTWFFVAIPPRAALSSIRLGAEGQSWRWQRASHYAGFDRAVPHLRVRLREYLDQMQGCP
ncbi:MAG: NUDIX hydrolase [Pseudomonadota bacterium]